MDELERLAEAIFHFWHNTHLDHDWENEEFIPYLPFEAADFERPWRHPNDAFRPWPNVRRLYDMYEGNAENKSSYFDRQLKDHGRFLPEANARAGEFIHQRKGEGHDWTEYNDFWAMSAHEDETRKINLENAQGAGTWIVSTLHFKAPYCRAVLTIPAKYTDVIGKGGNGRAVLYMKYDNINGRVLQVSKPALEFQLGAQLSATSLVFGRPIAAMCLC